MASETRRGGKWGFIQQSNSRLIEWLSTTCAGPFQVLELKYRNPKSLLSCKAADILIGGEEGREKR